MESNSKVLPPGLHPSTNVIKLLKSFVNSHLSTNLVLNYTSLTIWGNSKARVLSAKAEKNAFTAPILFNLSS